MAADKGGSARERVLFIVPPNLGFEDFVSPPPNVKSMEKGEDRFGAVITDVPLGVLALSGYIKQRAGCETRFIDFNVLLNQVESFRAGSFTEFIRDQLSCSDVRDFQPTIVAISVLFVPSYRNMLDLFAHARRVFPDALIVAGGGVPTNMSREIFEDSADIDALCFGEGELPLLDLVLAEDKWAELESDPAWITRDKQARGFLPERRLIEDLDEIENDYDLVDFADYALNPTIAAYPSITDPGSALPIMVSRGCVHRCSFCSSHTVHGRKMRCESIERVERGLRRLRDDYGAKTIVFQDDHFMFDRDRAGTIVAIVKKLGLTAFFPNSLALYRLDRAMLEALADIGVTQLVLAVESGSERVLKKVMHKPLDLRIIRQVVDDCRDLGIYTDVNILIGLPGETASDIEDARAFLPTIGANWFRINVATPLVGSEMFEICIENDYMLDDYRRCDYKRAIVETEDFSVDYIQLMAYVLNLELNFVHNADMALGHYEIALMGFENALSAKPEHPFAHHCASVCLKQIGRPEEAEEYHALAVKYAQDPEWASYVEMFDLANTLAAW